MSLETRVAVIGVAGALAGTLVGGLVTYAVTQQQISSRSEPARRDERRDAYAKYFGDVTRLWTHVFAIMEGGDRPKSLASGRSKLARWKRRPRRLCARRARRAEARRDRRVPT